MSVSPSIGLCVPSRLSKEPGAATDSLSDTRTTGKRLEPTPAHPDAEVRSKRRCAILGYYDDGDACQSWQPLGLADRETYGDNSKWR